MAENATATGKRHPLNLRTTKQIRDLLEQAAKNSGRSMAAEVEYRVAMSLMFDDGTSEHMGKPMYELLHLFSTCIKAVENHTGKKWLEDPQTYREAVEAMYALLKNLPQFMATGETQPAPGGLGKQLANMAVEQFVSQHRPEIERQASREAWEENEQ